MSAAESYEERDRVLAEVAVAHAQALTAGMNIIADWAATGQTFSANHVRSQLRAAGVDKASTGALFSQATRTRLIRVTGYEMSTDPRTRHRITTYVGTSAGQRKLPAKLPAPTAPPAVEPWTPTLFEMPT